MQISSVPSWKPELTFKCSFLVWFLLRYMGKIHISGMGMQGLSLFYSDRKKLQNLNCLLQIVSQSCMFCLLLIHSLIICLIYNIFYCFLIQVQHNEAIPEGHMVSTTGVCQGKEWSINLHFCYVHFHHYCCCFSLSPKKICSGSWGQGIAWFRCCYFVAALLNFFLHSLD